MDKKRQPSFSSSELEMLTLGVEKRAKLLFGTLDGATTAAMKKRGWQDVTSEVNAVGGFGRSTAEVKKKWVCTKSETKGKLVAAKREREKTGGGSNDSEEVSVVDSRIVGIMGEVCVVGIEGGFDSNRKTLQDLSGAPPFPSTLKSGGARAPPRYMAPAPLPAATFSFQ